MQGKKVIAGKSETVVYSAVPFPKCLHGQYPPGASQAPGATVSAFLCGSQRRPAARPTSSATVPSGASHGGKGRFNWKNSRVRVRIPELATS